MTHKYSIDPKIFELYPGYVRGVVLAFQVNNGSSPPELIELLRIAESSLRGQIDIDTITSHPRIASWREAYRKFGAKPSDYRPSMEAIARRVLREQELPAINALVEIGNIVSLQHLMPTGGHAIDHLSSDITLRPAMGDERFIPFGEEGVENPSPGEIIFTEGETVLTRRWTWRQSNHTLLVPDTREVEFNVDGLAPVSLHEVEETCGEIAELVARFCGGKTRWEILSIDNPSMDLSFSAEDTKI